jgi:hypothetical protein
MGVKVAATACSSEQLLGNLASQGFDSSSVDFLEVIRHYLDLY